MLKLKKNLKKSGAILVIAGVLSLSLPGQILAIDTSKDAFLGSKAESNLINNASFTDTNSMSVADIQDFLDKHGGALATISSDQLGDGANGRSAAQIIYDAARGLYPAAVGDWKGISINSSTGTISPKIILTYLEKEQSLVSKTSPSQNTLDCAMGYEYGQGCQYMFENYPSLRGFANQVGNGAWQLRYNFEYAIRGTKPSDAATHYVVGESTTLSDDHFTTNYAVTMSNAATAAIYSYTPYVFDSAYNFWQIFNNWFTPTAQPAPTPVPNDTSTFSEKTYDGNITVGGTKSKDSKVFFRNELIADAGSTQWQLTFQADVGKTDLAVEYRDSAGKVLATKQISVVRHKVADINGDGAIDIQDLSLMSTYWGQNKPAEALTDLNGDGIVDILDLSLLASGWGG